MLGITLIDSNFEPEERFSLDIVKFLEKGVIIDSF